MTHDIGSMSGVKSLEHHKTSPIDYLFEEDVLSRDLLHGLWVHSTWFDRACGLQVDECSCPRCVKYTALSLNFSFPVLVLDRIMDYLSSWYPSKVYRLSAYFRYSRPYIRQLAKARQALTALPTARAIVGHLLEAHGPLVHRVVIRGLVSADPCPRWLEPYGFSAAWMLYLNGFVRTPPWEEFWSRSLYCIYGKKVRMIADLPDEVVRENQHRRVTRVRSDKPIPGFVCELLVEDDKGVELKTCLPFITNVIFV